MHETFSPVPEAIAEVRHLLVRHLRVWGLTELASQLEVAVGELFTNAVCHGTGPVEITMAAFPGRIRVEVRDHGGGTPAIRPVQVRGPAIGGWGLRLVDQLVDAWDTQVRPGRTTVWVEQAIPDASA